MEESQINALFQEKNIEEVIELLEKRTGRRIFYAKVGTSIFNQF